MKIDLPGNSGGVLILKIDPPGNLGCFLKINGNLCVDASKKSKRYVLINFVLPGKQRGVLRKFNASWKIKRCSNVPKMYSFLVKKEQLFLRTAPLAASVIFHFVASKKKVLAILYNIAIY